MIGYLEAEFDQNDEYDELSELVWSNGNNSSPDDTGGGGVVTILMLHTA
jgi:hypothetical protein